ncbi:MAG: hypothetical protein ABJD97_14825 [Betaproteobacteria bacterium]
MTPVDFVSNSLFYRTEDGRIVFRPWGPRGPVYLLTEGQRRTRARIQTAFYAALVAGVWTFPDWTSPKAFGIRIGAFLGASYLLYWLYSLGLPRTTAPPRPTREHTRRLMRGALPRWLIGTFLALFGAALVTLVAALVLVGPTRPTLMGLVGVIALLAVFGWMWRATAPARGDER